MTITLRPSCDGDLPAIHAIYAHHAANSLSTLDFEAPPMEQMAVRRAEVLRRGMPWLVAEIDGAVAGYAFAGPFRLRAGFDNTVEDAIYVAPDRVGKGVGRRLLAAVIQSCEAAGFRQMVAVIGNSGNAASVGLHTALGFRQVGLLPAVGWKFDRWLDCLILQRTLGPGHTRPPER